MTIEIQQSLIGSLISDNSMYYRYMQDDLSFDYLADENLIQITERIVNEIKSGKRVDGIKAKALNPNHEKLITDCVLKSNIQAFELYHNELVVRHKSRVLSNVLENGLLQIQNLDDPDEIGVLVSQQIQQMAAAKTINEVSYRSIVDKAVTDIIDRKHSGQKLSGVDTGYTDLNELTDGWGRDELIITGGRPGMGKTSESLIRCYKMAKLGLVVLFFSLEMSTKSLINKLIAFELGISANKLKRGDITAEQEAKLHRIADTIMSSTLRIVDTVKTIDGIESFSTLFNAQKKLDFIAVDYIQIIRNHSQSEIRHRVTDNARRLKELGVQVGAPVNALAQLKRPTSSVSVPSPTMADLKESGGIEENADIIILLHREGYYEPELGDDAEMIIAKNRNGSTGVITRKFNYPFLEYKEVGNVFEETQVQDNSDIGLIARVSARLGDDEVQF